MTSKNLYFKLMKEDLKSRLWAVSLIGLGFFFLYPVFVAFSAGSIKGFEIYEEGMKWYSNKVMSWLSFDNGMTVFVMMVTALICGLSGFSYLNSRSKVDFYHSIPVKREKLYLANYINGILMVAVPYAVSMVLAVFLGISNGVEGGPLWQAAIAAFGLHMTYFILLYTTVVIAAMMTGNLVVAFLGCMVFSFLVPLAVSLAQGYFGIFFRTYIWETGQTLVACGIRISPVMEYLYQMSRYSDGEVMWTAAVAALLVAVVLAVLGCLLYRKRPSEAAGKAMAFDVSRPIIRILITMVSALGLGAFFWSARESTGWAVFGVLCGAVISHCVIEIIYHFDFKKLFANKVQLIGCTLVSLAVLFVFRYDLVGYDRYLPDTGEVKGAAVEVSELSDWTSYGNTRRQEDGGYVWESQPSLIYKVEHMKYTDTENLRAIAAAGIAETMKNGESRNWYPESALPTGEIDSELSGTYSEVKICYTLKSGRRVYRGYRVNLDDMMPQVEKLYGSQEYQTGTFPLMTVKPEDVSAVYYSEMQKETRLDKLTAEEKTGILETYRREFATMTLSQMKEELPLGLIRFTSELDEEGLAWYNKESASGFKRYPDYRYSVDELATRDYYPVYPSFKDTIALLKSHQIKAGEYYKSLDIQSIDISWYGSFDSYGDMVRTAILITDPDEIAELKQIMMAPGHRYYNNLFKLSDVDASITVQPNGKMRNYDTGFARGEVPEFVKERLKASKTD